MELYVHIPFCVKKCGYCDFVSAPAGKTVQAAYMKALRREISMAAWELSAAACHMPAGKFWQAGGKESVTSVFFGGGTPSVVEAEEIAETLSCIRREFVLAENAEVTLEANPGTLTKEKLLCYRRAGVNRLSLGLQSAKDRELALLGRIHTFSEFEESFRLAREAGFSNINVDLMAALPGQTRESFAESLRMVTELSPAPEHISVYSLIIEEGTPFFEKYHRQAEARDAGMEDCSPLPSEEEERAMYAMTEQILAAYGFERYEISNYAVPGFACRHNVGYWTGVPYLGFGISAASYINRMRFSNVLELEAYLKYLSEPESFPELETEAVSGRDPAAALKNLRQNEEKVTIERAMEEFMFLGLRMTEGVSEKEFKRRFGKKMSEVYGEALTTMKKDGLMEQYFSGDASNTCWRLTSRGMDVGNYVLAEFLL